MKETVVRYVRFEKGRVERRENMDGTGGQEYMRTNQGMHVYETYRELSDPVVTYMTAMEGG